MMLIVDGVRDFFGKLHRPIIKYTLRFKKNYTQIRELWFLKMVFIRESIVG